MKRRRDFILLALVLGLLLACNLPPATIPSTPNAILTAAAQTLTALPLPQSSPPAAVPPASPTFSPSPPRLSTGIEGYVYYDDNRNGQMDAGEKPYPDYPLYLSLQEFGDAVQETQTDARGYYSFTVTPGEYWLSYAGGPPVCPAHDVQIRVNTGELIRQDFGVLPCDPYDANCTCP